MTKIRSIRTVKIIIMIIENNLYFIYPLTGTVLT